MTDIKDLELRIKSAESTLEMLRGELEELRQQEQQEPESLLGRRATHPEYGRGIIASDKPDTFKEVRFTIRNDEFTDGADQLFVRFDDLTLDPATLTTAAELENAPEYTIIEVISDDAIFTKFGDTWFGVGETVDLPSNSMSPSRVVRWGNGQ
ncbi:hypothetical protein JY504_00860 [Corynebacterium amycolatum]|uniref:hypothetical protein n=1 Tax=Corynebacterium amycolatum TaxID=43765 RepID=UPI002119D83A|nr:hypothetical protein [Corynebacterium amycolatum]MCQ9168595.1 hypothetical protein [Corynebacterium amycolatum]MCQ9176073.1 hypothetical protein [Corynebacterium amycolatum]